MPQNTIKNIVGDMDSVKNTMEMYANGKTNRKIRILSVPSDGSGVGYHRSIWPHKYIQEHYGDEFDIDIIPMSNWPFDNLKDFFSKYDIVQMHKQFDDKCEIITLIKSMGIPVVLDMDDNFKLGNDHPMAISSQRCGWAGIAVNHLKMADYVTTTTPIFAKELRKYNSRVFVLPNAIDEKERQFSTEKNKSDKIRFGIICGSTHMKDIELMDGIRALPKEIRDKMQIVLCGFDTNGTTTIYNKDTGEVRTRQLLPHESVWCRYEEFLTDNYRLVNKEHAEFLKGYVKGLDDPFEDDFYRRYWTKDIHHYAEHYKNVDVLLAPLKENDFNKMKSQLKFVEAGFTDTAVIASNFGPYTIDGVSYLEKGNKVNENGNCLLVDARKNRKQWAKYIKYLVENPDVIEKMKENLRDEMKEKYSMDKICKERVELYRKIYLERQYELKASKLIKEF